MVTRTPPESEDTVAYPFPQLSTAQPAGTAGAGLKFTEEMSGLVSMGSTDPVEGYRNPGAVGMTLRAAMTIASVPEFVADPEHRGRWDAEGAIPVWGGHIRSAGRGAFRLFQRAIDAGGKPVRQVVYDIPIAVGEHTCLLRGRKIIEPGPPSRLWPATTTLYVRFLEPGTSEKVIAAGILQPTALGLLRQPSTIRLTGDYPFSVKGRHLCEFAEFVAGSLARTYVLGRRW